MWEAPGEKGGVTVQHIRRPKSKKRELKKSITSPFITKRNNTRYASTGIDIIRRPTD